MKAKRENQRKLDEGASRYRCRLCGDPLPAGFPGLFHPQCLILDKQWRTQEQRRREKERFAKWLSRQQCTRCGAKLELEVKKHHPPNENGSCEVSHDTPDPRMSHKPGESTQELLGADQPRILARSAAGTAKEAQGKDTPSKSHRNGSPARRYQAKRNTGLKDS